MKSIKSFVNGIVGLTPEQKELLMSSKVHLELANIKKLPNGGVEFDVVENFFNTQRVTLKPEQKNIWDVVMDFNSIKNGLNTLKTLQEQGKPLSWEVYKLQNKMTPTGGAVKNDNLLEFLNSLTEEEYKGIVSICDTWMAKNMKKGNSFDTFFINGTNGVTLEDGQFLQMYDNQLNEVYFGKVLKATTNGFVTMFGTDTFTLSAHSEPTILIGEQVPAEVKEGIDPAFAEMVEDLETQKIEYLEKYEKIATRQAEAKAKAEAKELKAFERVVDKAIKLGAITQIETENGKGHYVLGTQKFKNKTELMNHLKDIAGVEQVISDFEKSQNAENQKVFEELQGLILDTPEKIAEAVAKANSVTLPSDLKKAINQKFRDAKATLKSKATNEPQPEPQDAPEPKAKANLNKATAKAQTDKPEQPKANK